MNNYIGNPKRAGIGRETLDYNKLKSISWHRVAQKVKLRAKQNLNTQPITHTLGKSDKSCQNILNKESARVLNNQMKALIRALNLQTKTSLNFMWLCHISHLPRKRQNGKM